MASYRARADVRELLRYIDDPDRLRRNPLAARCIDAKADLWEFVRQAASRLREPLRTIILRCDLARELHKIVAADLSISERHFYRLRSLALVHLEAALSKLPVVTHVSTTTAGPVSVLLSYANAQQNAGNFDAAIATLQKARASTQEGAEQAAMDCRLADICCHAGRLSEARSYLERAQTLATLATPINLSKFRFIDSQLAAAKFQLAWSCGDLNYMRLAGKPLVHRLRSIAHSSIGNQAVQEALISVLLTLADLDCLKGAFGDALTAASEAIMLFNTRRLTNDALRLRCLNTVADLRTFKGVNLGLSISELSDVYVEARSKNIPRVGVSIAINFSNIYMRSGRMDQALSFGHAALDIGRSVSPPEEFARNNLAVAAIHLFRRELRQARVLLAQAYAQIQPENTLVKALATLLEADVSLVEQNYAVALATARTSERILKSLDVVRYLGSVLRVEAQALEALGDHAKATRAIGDSLDILKSAGHPFVLARSYRAAARIRRERKLQLAADDLMRGLCALSGSPFASGGVT
jgi:tetratricopeptide (TPR) repeat protein